jgi:type IV pilus assembly protein PilB
MSTIKETVVDILLQSKLVTQEQLDKALAVQRQRGLPLRRVLIEEKLVTEDTLLSLLSKHLYMPTIHLTKYRFDPEIVGLIPERMARQYMLIPLSRFGNTLTVAMADPLNIFALDDLKVITGCSIDTVLSPEEEITKAIDVQYKPKAADMQEILEQASLKDALGRNNVEVLKQEDIELTSVVRESETAPIVKLVNLMLTQALKQRASDIHIEPEVDCLRVRYRVDGALHEDFTIPKLNQNAIIARLKILSSLDITETRIPQDGRFKVKFENREVDFRVSSLPTTFGQKFVLRLLDKTNLSIGLDKLGFSEQPLQIFKEAIAKPFGMILVTGPTGSGKSTTLYSILNQLNTVERNIITVEDPVEYQLDGITQIQVKPEIGLNFASGLRALLRQSPDVIMIGEIRDSETADIAIKAALTGQLVLSTLHTNDAISSVMRLMDMGVEPFLVASSVVMLCAQRLCRRMCVKCRKEIDVSESVLRETGIDKVAEYTPLPDGKKKPVFYQASGCKYCNNTGFYGRIAILETVLVDDRMREMIIKRESIDLVKEHAVTACKMRTLRDDAFVKVLNEMTTIEEALRVTTEE